MKTFLLFPLLLISLNIHSQATAVATVNTTATVVEPIEISKSVDLNFGNVISSLSSGSLVLSPDGLRTANGAYLPSSIPGEVTPAEAIVTHGSYSYSISLPESFTLYNQNNPNQFLIVDQFLVQPDPTAAGIGVDILKIGATLNLQANQAPGFYTNSAGFNVTVSYN